MKASSRTQRWTCTATHQLTNHRRRRPHPTIIPRRHYSKEQQAKDHAHCVEMVQARDKEGYLCGLLMPPTSRQAYFALRAFNAEIAGIKDASLLMGRNRAATDQDLDGVDISGMSDASLASRLRMAWWRDGIAQIYDENKNDAITSKGADSILATSKNHPTMRSLAQAIHDHELTHVFLRRIIEAREEDLGVVQYKTKGDVAQYGEDTVSSVLYLSLECVGVRDEASDMIASDIGVALGLITALRSTSFRAMQGEISIPIDLTTKYSITRDSLWNAANAHNDESVGTENTIAQESVRNAACELAEMASFHLHRARSKQSAVPNEARSCLLPAVCGLEYLDSLKKCNFDVFHPSLGEGRRLGLMMQLGRAWVTGSF